MSAEGAVHPSVHLVLIRHAESRNNEVYRDARRLFGGGTPDFDLDGWNGYVDERRSADPGLSEKGRRQAEELGRYLRDHLAAQASRPVRVVTSPMRRTLETIRPALVGLRDEKFEGGDDGGDEALAASVIVNAFYHESEGCHIREVPHRGMNPSEITELLGDALPLSSSSSSSSSLSFDGFDPSDPTAGWYSHGTGPETRPESESRAAKFYLWLCEHLDSQLSEASARPDRHGDLYDAGVARPDEEHELDHLKFQRRRRRRRTCVLVGHGDFMGLVLKRIVAGYGHAVEREGVHHRSAFVHFNTGITELEYFGNGRFLVMSVNRTPHLDCLDEDDAADLKTGGGLKDGWSFLVPDEEFLLDAEVDVAFEDELEGHVREQAEAMRELYLGKRRSSTNVGSDGDGAEEASFRVSRKTSLIAEVNVADSQGSSEADVALVVKRSMQLVGCATLNVESGRLADLVVRPSARNSRVGKTLVRAARDRARKSELERIFVVAKTEESRIFFEKLGFREVETRVEGTESENDTNGNDWEGMRMELVP